MIESVPLVLVGVLVSFGILRVVLPRRVTVLRRPAGAFELRRPLSRRLFELSRLAFWTVLLMIFFVASWWTDFVLGVLVGGVAVGCRSWIATGSRSPTKDSRVVCPIPGTSRATRSRPE